MEGLQAWGLGVQVDMLVEVIYSYAGLLLLSQVPDPNEKENLLFLESWKGFWSIAEFVCNYTLVCEPRVCVYVGWIAHKWPGCSACGSVTC